MPDSANSVNTRPTAMAPDASTSPVGHTPGPWAWFGNRSGGVYLATTHSGRKYVMGFQRYGMNGAQPTFRIADRMMPAAELVEFAVGDGTARGFKQADKDVSVYRYDVDAIDSPDARLIAAAPELLEALVQCEMYFACLSGMTVDDAQDAMDVVRAAIAKARGTTPTPEVSHVG